MDKKIAKQKIKELVEKYEQVVKSGQFKKYSEEQTKKDFIMPLFEALGWDVFSKNEVSAEESIKSSGRVDYGFYINDRTKFYLESKPLKADLYKPEYAEQAIRYSWNKSVVWAVLTNFKSIKVFNAQNISETLGGKLLFEIPYSEYIERFEQLWLLSKESFEKELINKYATEHGKMLQRVSITSTLSKDLSDCRDILIKELAKYNEDKNISQDLLDEGVQRLLDRLIFIRVAEDRGIEEKTLEPLIHQWKTGKKDEPLFKSMVARFRELDKTYNSNLFQTHAFEEWEDWAGKATEQVIKKLYGKEGYYEYDFKIMPADILGTVYENYLGHRLSKSKKGLTIDKDAKKRKEQGIYYTPNFIVDYIVKNALKPVLDKCRSINDLKKIKVLDPACGSGSFLIKALEVINDKYKEFGSRDNKFTKLTILTENLYGVDLDEQAVEITRLNLLISALDTRMKMPILDHIKNGNSLISGTDEELKKYFGKNFREKKPFNWQEEFPEVFKQGGFDVVIGNPPYIMVENLPITERSYLMSKYDTAIKRFDIYIAFIERGLKLLRSEGFLSFIIPFPFLNQNYAEKIRGKILSDFHLVEIVDLSEVKIFGDAVVRNCIITIENPLTKEDGIERTVIKKIYNDQEAQNLKNLPAKFFKHSFFTSSPKFMYRTDLDEGKSNLLKKIEEESIKLGNICYVNWGARSGNVKKYVVNKPVNDLCKKMINARNIERYQLNYTGDYLIYKKDELYNPMFEELFESPKIIVRDISGKSRLKANIDEDKYYAEHTVNLAVPYCYLENVNRRGLVLKQEQVVLSRKYNLKYILAQINSKLVNWYFTSKLGGGLHVYPDDVKQFPIFKIETKKQDRLINLVNKILDLNKELQKTPENSNKWNSIKSEIKKTDKKIDEEVYKLYGLTPGEIKIVENKTK